MVSEGCEKAPLCSLLRSVLPAPSPPPPSPHPGSLELRKGYFLHKEFRSSGGAGTKAQTAKVSGVPGSLPLGPGPAPHCGFSGTLFHAELEARTGPANPCQESLSHLGPGGPEPYNKPSRS